MSSRASVPLLVLSILVVFAGCSRRQEEAPQVQAAEPGTAAVPGEADEQVEPGVPMRLTDEGRARADEAPPVSATQRADSNAGVTSGAPSRIADPRDTAFAALRFHFTPSYPYDLVLGRLQHSYVGSASDRSAYRATRDLLGALVAGELPQDLLDPDMGRGTRAILSEMLWRAPALPDARVGPVAQLSETQVSLPFRLVGEGEEAVGELVLTNRDGKWYTADVQIDYRDVPPDRRFDAASVTARPGR